MRLFDEAEFTVGAHDGGTGAQQPQRGRVHEASFRHPDAVAAEIIAARRKALEKQGFTLVHEAPFSDFGHVLTMRRTSPNEAWVEVRAETFNEGEFSESSARVLEVSKVPSRLQPSSQKRGVKDAARCQDLPQIGRMQGARIDECASPRDQPAPPVLRRLADAGSVRGDVEIVTYVEAPETSALEVALTYEAALAKAGWTLLDRTQSDAQQSLLVQKSEGGRTVFLLVAAESVNDSEWVRTTVSTFTPREP